MSAGELISICRRADDEGELANHTASVDEQLLTTSLNGKTLLRSTNHT